MAEERSDRVSASELPLAYEASRSDESHLWQGELISNLLLPVRDVAESHKLSAVVVKQERVGYAIVLNQDCDLIYDFEARGSGKATHKLLHSVLFVLAEPVRERVDPDPDTTSAKRFRRLRQNSDERYHFLSAVPPEIVSVETPELVVDFKRFFSIRANDVYDQLRENTASRRCRLKSEYSRELVQRFLNFHARIAVPLPHHHLADGAGQSTVTTQVNSEGAITLRDQPKGLQGLLRRVLGFLRRQ